MTPFRLFDLPPELILIILEDCHPRDIATFIRTSHASWNIGHPILYKLSVPKKKELFLWAAGKNRPNIVQYILDDILPLLNKSSKSPLRDKVLSPAIRGQCIPILNMLLDNGADAGNALMEATILSKLNVVRALLSRGVTFPAHQYENHRVDVGRENILHFAAISPATRVLELVLTFPGLGLDINKADANGNTALLKAATNGCPVSVRLLLAHGADPNVVNAQRRTPLTEAATDGDEDVIEMLLNAGANINGTDTENPLMNTVIYENVNAAAYLLQRGADPNWVGTYGVGVGHTPLHRAASEGDDRLLGLLVAHGADVHLKDSRGRKAIEVAVEEGHVLCQVILTMA
ncbi:uncharacterized protein DSM5745_11375 [Aspergillus mulundensis]|uniref:Uncharacterized protein n=1 Tax=Aspergillus mulundensis TaxID=1810919 RepID=A0A3D8Q868_9EURO|nr:hypothetical protein DSM5745_11375 [Aspergillus mulundensis]RDW57857.1 hypothetical protein DSM5745_11375 [Aspergillus mulundensis]